MHGRPKIQSLSPTHASHPERWRILGVLVLALLVTSIDHTIINVAMPRLVGDLGANSAQLQWIVASYTIVFAGLLLTAGSLGDRLGRRHAFLAGVATFLGGSVIAATAGSTTALIVGRCVMGVGGALIMPTTLSILVNVFGDPRERAKAIAAWTAASGAGIAVGPIVGGALMRSYSWSSVFWINVPLLAAAFVGAVQLVPESRDPHATRLDPVGAVLSIAGIGSLVYAIIQAPERGWTSTASLINFAVGAVLTIAFVAWEIRRDDPMLDIGLFRSRGFSAGSIALTLLFFAMAGTVFLQAQYLQFVLEYTPLAAGFALVPAAIGMLIGTGAGAHLAVQHGGRVAVTAGTVLATIGVAVQAALVDGGSYVPTGAGLFLFGLGAGIAMPAATEMIMASLPPERAGVGSAVNDTVREFGGALGVAVIGSVAATSYASTMHRELDRFTGLTKVDRNLFANNVGSAVDASRKLGTQGAEIASVARNAFVDSMHSSLWIGVGLAFCAALIAFTQLPRHTGHAIAVADESSHGERHTTSNPVDVVGHRQEKSASAKDSHIGRIVVGTLLSGLVTAIALVVGPLAGAKEHVITGSVLITFAIAWAMLALLSGHRTNQPQRWAIVPAVFMAVTGAGILTFAPTGNQLGWVWPPVVGALTIWMVIQVRRTLQSRTRVWIVYPILVAMMLSAVGGAYETYRESVQTDFPTTGRLIDIGDHRLHINCTGVGSPTVVLEPGLGEPSAAMAWITASIAGTTRVCVYDRAGRGWSDPVSTPRDGAQTATDLHTLLQRAGEAGPYVLAGHSAGGIYVLNFAHLYPEEVAGVVLLDSMHPEQYTRIATWPAFYQTFRRFSALLPSLSRFGVGSAIYGTAYGELPELERDEQRAFWSTPRHSRSVRDEFSKLRTAMDQSNLLTSLGNRPLVVVSAQKEAADGWMAAQQDLKALSTNSVQRVLDDATHSSLTENKETADQSSQAIRDVVASIRTGTPVR